MTAVTAAARQLERKQEISMIQQQQQPSREVLTKQDEVVSDMQKRKNTEMEDNSEMKRVKVNQPEAKVNMESIVDEEWKRISVSMEKQARAVQLKSAVDTETKVAEFISDMKFTVINKPALESKPTTSPHISALKVTSESQQKKLTSLESASRSKQDKEPEKSDDTRSRWDDSERSGRSRQYDSGKKGHRQKSPSHRFSKTPPRSYRSKVSPPRALPKHRKSLSLKDDKDEKDSSARKDIGRKTSTPTQSKEVIVISDEKSKQNDPSKATVKSSVIKPSSSGLSTTAATTTTTTTTAAPSFKFSWMAKTTKPTLLPKAGVQFGPMPGRKSTGRGTYHLSNCVVLFCYLVNKLTCVKLLTFYVHNITKTVDMSDAIKLSSVLKNMLLILIHFEQIFNLTTGIVTSN